MKVLFAIKRMDGAVGGAERVLACIVNALVERGHDISLLSFDKPNGESFYPLDKRVRRICLGLGDATRQTSIEEIFPRILALRRAVRFENPDVIVAFMHSMFVPVTFALIGTRFKIIASEHIVPHHYKTRKLEFFFFSIAARMLKTITVLSSAIRDLYPEFIRKKMVVMPNPVYVTARRATPAGRNDALKIILNVGRLDIQKDQKILIDAFAKLSHRYPDWRLRIIGEGDLRPDLEKQIKNYNLESKIDLPGITKDIGKEYESAHLFAMPSSYESFGLVTAEAMSYGLPVIGFSDCPGTNELIANEENGLLVKSRSSDALAEALDQMMASAERRTVYGRRSALSLSQFSPDYIVNLWEDLIRRQIP